MIDYLRNIFKINPKSTALKTVEKLQKVELVILLFKSFRPPPPPLLQKKNFGYTNAPISIKTRPLPFWSILIFLNLITVYCCFKSEFLKQSKFYLRMMYAIILNFSKFSKNIHFFNFSRSVFNFFHEIIKKTVENLKSH